MTVCVLVHFSLLFHFKTQPAFLSRAERRATPGTGLLKYCKCGSAFKRKIIECIFNDAG